MSYVTLITLTSRKKKSFSVSRELAPLSVLRFRLPESVLAYQTRANLHGGRRQLSSFIFVFEVIVFS